MERKPYYSAREAGAVMPNEATNQQAMAEREKLAAHDQCEGNTVGMASVGYDDPLQSVHRRLMMRQHETTNLERAAVILHQHPEFADFLWLLRSGLV